MELNIFHKIVLGFAIVILSIGIFESVQNRLTGTYKELSSVVDRYKVIETKPLFDKETNLFSRNWMKNLLASSFLYKDANNIPEKTENIVVKLKNSSLNTGTFVMSFPSDISVANLMRDLKAVSAVEIVEPDFEIHLQTTLQDKSITTQNSNFQNKTDTQFSYKVGIIDSGISLEHPDFKDKSIKAKTVLSNTKDSVGHGTHLAGLVLKQAPKTEIYTYKFTDGKVGKLSDLIQAIDLAVQDEVDLLNLSLGLPTNSKFLEASIKYLQENKITVVAAAGNLNSTVQFYPAAYEGVIAVASLNQAGTKYHTSNFGDWITVSTNGQNIDSTSLDSTYAYLSGTSQSGAIVSGLIANYAIENQVKDFSPEEVFAQYKFEYTDNYTDLLGVRLNIPSL